MLIFPEVLTKQEVEDLNHMAEQVENFFKEKGWSIYCQMHGASIQALVIYIVFYDNCHYYTQTSEVLTIHISN